MNRYLRFFCEIVGGSRARGELEVAAERAADVSALVRAGPVLDVLDLGNGELRPQSYILASQGHRVTGVDFVNAPRLSGHALAYGFARAILRSQLGLRRSPQNLSLICADVTKLPFAAESFDLITSIAAFEHFLDIPKVFEEAHRVLRPGGVLWAYVRLYTNFTGAHDIYLGTARSLESLPAGYIPWGHLRGIDRKVSVPLNRLRARDYESAARRYFPLVRSYYTAPGSQVFLTPDIRAELHDYTEDELIRGFRIIVQKAPVSKVQPA